MPGVVSVSAGWPLPLSSSGIGITFDIEERPQLEGERAVSRASISEPGYFQTLRIPLIRGREFQDTDTKPVRLEECKVNDLAQPVHETCLAERMTEEPKKRTCVPRN